ncbi:GGDEF domain-containing protein [Scandinavium lactucae]|uniref:diguanylate cyclase n=1 Tax=Scandinavium lactucae TaxID=3095028 RepID=A0ABU4QIH3_9ENTR|nr:MULTISPECIES: membrane-associated sensor domain-containing protein [unclassified Scandinavium]MDX6039091.1 membrane-associated sensor domain-containing protein [Scandinavium sp. V105_6]MDX6050162.1 membrane-associated sensor domain-containing protein [Scandinavium sp. V105_1]
MDIKHSTGEVAIASVKGYLWFLCLNIICCLWLVLRVFGGASIPMDAENYTLPLYGIIGFSVINGLMTWRLHDRINEGLYQKCLPAIVLIFGAFWSVIFFHMLNDFKQPTIAMVALVLVLLPATITFYLSAKLLTLFIGPIIATVIVGEIISPLKFTLLQSIAAAIILLVVLSARYILLESYQRTQRSEYEKNLLIKKLLKLANYDTLTGLYNRHSLSEYFTRSTRALRQSKKSLFLIVLDIDFFKQYNDLYGHVEGDKCLIRVSRCIEQSLRKETDAAFRFGGEEFVVLATCDGPSSALSIGKRIQHALAEARIAHKGSTVAPRVTLSLGVAQWHPGMTLEALLEFADKQLYQAKRDGRNRLCWEGKK